MSTKGLFAWRVVGGVYTFTVLFTEIGYQDTHGEVVETRQSFSYFTNLGYWGIGFYFAFTAAHTGARAFRGRTFLSSWPGWLKWLHSVFYATVTVYPFIITSEFAMTNRNDLTGLTVYQGRANTNRSLKQLFTGPSYPTVRSPQPTVLGTTSLITS